MRDTREVLASRLAVDVEGTRRGLSLDLRSLANGIEAALVRLDSNDRVSGNLIANAAMLTADIARWNLLLEYRSLTEKP